MHRIKACGAHKCEDIVIADLCVEISDATSTLHLWFSWGILGLAKSKKSIGVETRFFALDCNI